MVQQIAVGGHVRREFEPIQICNIDRVLADFGDNIEGEERLAPKPTDLQFTQLSAAPLDESLDTGHDASVHLFVLKRFVAVSAAKVAGLRRHDDEIEKIGMKTSRPN